jgi:hypothetical protein
MVIVKYALRVIRSGNTLESSELAKFYGGKPFLTIVDAHAQNLDLVAFLSSIE